MLNPHKVNVKSSETKLGANDYVRKINVWSANKHSNELHTAVSVAFSIPFSVHIKKW